MDMEFFSLQLTRDELLEIHAALAQRIMLEDLVRDEKGLEPPARHPLMERVDDLLALTDKEEGVVSDRIDEELWEYAWFAFTDEWAWFRASQAVEKEADGDAIQPKELRKRIEERYRKEFERYVKELEMGDGKKTPGVSGR
ncbi:hypothetical protein KJ925_00530 [Patescibacteria group bacterium]|nr:hypothetical protein [Patescibacteria group bacterium]